MADLPDKETLCPVGHRKEKEKIRLGALTQERIGLLEKRMARQPTPPPPIKIAGAWHPDAEAMLKGKRK